MLQVATLQLDAQCSCAPPLNPLCGPHASTFPVSVSMRRALVATEGRRKDQEEQTAPAGLNLTTGREREGESRCRRRG